MLSEVQNRLLEIIRTNGTVSSMQLSDDLSISKRTVINYVQAINQEYDSLVLSSREGYSLNPSVFEDYLNSAHGLLHGVSSHLISTIISLLNGFHDRLDIVEYSYQVSYSESSIKNDIYQIKDLIAGYDLQIDIRKNIAYLTGSETGKRSFLLDILLSSDDQSFELMNLHYGDYPYQQIRRLISEIISRDNYSVNDYALINLTFHLIISMVRIKNGHLIEDEPKMTYVRNIDCRYAKEITECLQRSYGVEFPPFETDTLALRLRACGLKSNQRITMENLQDHIWPKFHSFMVSLAQELKEHFSIDLLMDTKVFPQLAYHMSNLIRRSEAFIPANNPYSADLKVKHPVSFESACYIALRISEHCGIKVSENEIGYIAMYIGNLIHSYAEGNNRLKVAMVIPAQNSLEQDLLEFYRSQFGQLARFDLFNRYDQFDSRDYDLILNTIRIPKNIMTPSLTISPFANEEDIRSIHGKLNQLRTLNYRTRIENNLRRFGSEGQFIQLESVSSIADLISLLSEPLIAAQKANSDLIAEITRREELNSCSLPGFIIFRTLLPSSEKSSLSVAVLGKPLTVNRKTIRYALLLTYEKGDYASFEKILHFLTRNLSNHNVLNRIKAASDMDGFIDLLLKS